MSITIGFWIIPTMITVCCLIWAIVGMNEGGYLGGAGEVVGGTLISMFAWLVYFATAYFIGGG